MLAFGMKSSAVTDLFSYDPGVDVGSLHRLPQAQFQSPHCRYAAMREGRQSDRLDRVRCLSEQTQGRNDTVQKPYFRFKAEKRVTDIPILVEFPLACSHG
jgi:hypothetical protein